MTTNELHSVLHLTSCNLRPNSILSCSFLEDNVPLLDTGPITKLHLPAGQHGSCVAEQHGLCVAQPNSSSPNLLTHSTLPHRKACFSFMVMEEPLPEDLSFFQSLLEALSCFPNRQMFQPRINYLLEEAAHHCNHNLEQRSHQSVKCRNQGMCVCARGVRFQPILDCFF